MAFVLLHRSRLVPEQRTAMLVRLPLLEWLLAVSVSQIQIAVISSALQLVTTRILVKKTAPFVSLSPVKVERLLPVQQQVQKNLRFVSQLV